MRSYTVVLILFMTACGHERDGKKFPPKVNSQDYLVHSTLYAQSSAEYKAMCYQAYRLARYRVSKALENGTENPAVVLDLDETVLDNSPYTAWQVESGNPYTPETWSQWVDAAEAAAVPGAVGFLQWADSSGVELFYVSNRSEDGLSPTLDNLRNLGVPQADSSHVFLKTTTSDKSERREKVKSRGVDVILYIGDNLGDYSEIWDKPSSPSKRMEYLTEANLEMGVKFIVLPNSLYGTWEAAIYNYDRSITDHRRDSLRRTGLKAWTP